MSIDDITNRQPHTYEIDVGADAVELLRSWHGLVHRLPHLIDIEERRRTTWGLVAWYERVFDDDDYAVDPPIEGLDVLIDELALASVPHDVHAELAQARWAIRVAEELVKWRDCLRRAGLGTSPTGPATDRLELAIEEARRHMKPISESDGPPPEPDSGIAHL